jgi:hypothetical protein
VLLFLSYEELGMGSLGEGPMPRSFVFSHAPVRPDRWIGEYEWGSGLTPRSSLRHRDQGSSGQ